MPKPSVFKFISPDIVIHRVSWWGERIMALNIATTLLLLRTSFRADAAGGLKWRGTRVPTLLEAPEWSLVAINVAFVIYFFVLMKIIIHPTRDDHRIGLPLGVLLFGARAGFFIELYLRTDQGGWGNVAERTLLLSTAVIYHTWGLWADRRVITYDEPLT